MADRRCGTMIDRWTSAATQPPRQSTQRRTRQPSAIAELDAPTRPCAAVPFRLRRPGRGMAPTGAMPMATRAPPRPATALDAQAAYRVSVKIRPPLRVRRQPLPGAARPHLCQSRCSRTPHPRRRRVRTGTRPARRRSWRMGSRCAQLRVRAFRWPCGYARSRVISSTSAARASSADRVVASSCASVPNRSASAAVNCRPARSRSYRSPT